MLNAPIEEVVAGPEIAAPLHQLQRPKPAQGIVEAAPLASYPAFAATALWSAAL
jgi:hypothetical protein